MGVEAQRNGTFLLMGSKDQQIEIVHQVILTCPPVCAHFSIQNQPFYPPLPEEHWKQNLVLRAQAAQAS